MGRTIDRSAALLVALGLALAVMPAPAAMAADPVTQTFSFTGAEQTFLVPVGVNTVHVVLIGGRGGSFGGTASGGMGARVEGDMAVTPSTQVFIQVGGNGPNGSELQVPGGFNGGGAGGGSGSLGYAAGGGGASDIRTVSRTVSGSLESRLIIAAGGGGAAASTAGSAPGGDAGQPAGGAGGGSAGSASAGGSGGVVLGSSASAGLDGGLGTGGDGANDFLPGGGGGGGRYGGGGGGAGDASGSFSTGGGGGGGSSYTGSATSASVSVDPTGTPLVIISYETSLAEPGTVAAHVDVAPSAACLELNTTAVDFGTLPLGAFGSGTPQVELTNCGLIDQTVMVRGTDASSANAAWNLVDFTDCGDPAMGIDDYGLGVRISPTTFLSVIETNRTLVAQSAGAVDTYDALIFTACPGSSGTGDVMSMQFHFLATE